MSIKSDIPAGDDMKSMAPIFLISILILSTTGLLASASSGSPNILANSDWPTFRGDDKHTGLSIFSTEENSGRLNWSFRTGGRIRTSPVTGPDGSIYFASDDGLFYALDENGKQKWTFNVGNLLGSGVNDLYDSSPLVDTNGNVYIATDSGSMYSFTSSGSSRWKQSIEMRGQLRSSPVMDDQGIIYIGSESSISGGVMSALYSSNGTFKWRYRTDSGIISSPAIDNNGNILFGSQEFAFYCLYPNGTLNWKETSNSAKGLVVSSPSIDSDGNIYFGHYSKGSIGVLWSFDSDGGYNWDYTNFRDVVYSSPAIGPDGTIYIGSDDKALYAINGADGAFKWAYVTTGKIISSPAVDSNGIIYFGSEDNYLYSINPDGSLRWKFLTNGWIHSSPAILSDGKVLVGSDDGYLYSIFKGNPTHPRSVNAEAGNEIVNLTWEEPEEDGGSPVTGYSILRKEMGSAIEMIAPLHPTTTYSDTDVINGVTYQYFITAWNLLGESNRTEPVSATPMTIPDPLTNLSVFNGSGYVILTWDLPADDGGSPLISLRLYRNTDSTGSELIDEIDPGVFYYNDTSVENGVRYYYGMSAVNEVGVSVGSNVVEASPMGLTTTPRNLTAVAGDGSILLSWDEPENNRGSPVIRYHIHVESISYEDALLTTTENESYNHTDLENGIEYIYHIMAENAIGLSDPSDKVKATPLGPPSEPVNLIAVQIDISVKLTWEVPEDDGGTPITGYILYRSINGGEYEFLRQLKEPETLEFINNGVTHPNRYSYRIFSENRIGGSVRYSQANITVITIPDVPTNLTVVSGDGFVLLTWDGPLYDGGSPLTGFSIYREGDGTQFKLVTVGSDITEYNDTTAFNGQVYGYSIVAVNIKGESGRTDSIDGIPMKTIFLPGAPRDLTALYSNEKITLTWKEPEDDGGSEILSYNVYRRVNDSGFDLLASLGVDILFHNDQNVEPGHTYYYKLTSQNQVGESVFSIEVNITIEKKIDPIKQDNTTGGNDDKFDYTPFIIAGAIILVVILLISAIAFLLLRNKKPVNSIETSTGQTTQYLPQQHYPDQISAAQIHSGELPAPQGLQQPAPVQQQLYPAEAVSNNGQGTHEATHIPQGGSVEGSSNNLNPPADPPESAAHEAAHVLQGKQSISADPPESVAHEEAHVLQG